MALHSKFQQDKMTLSLYSEPWKQGINKHVVFQQKEYRNTWQCPSTCFINAAQSQLPSTKKQKAFLDKYTEPSKKSAQMLLYTISQTTQALCYSLGCSMSPTWPVDTYSLGIAGFGKPSKVTRQSVVLLNCTYRWQFGKTPTTGISQA